MSSESNRSRKDALLRLGKKRLEKRRKAKEYFRRMKMAQEKAPGASPKEDAYGELSILLLMDDEQKQELMKRLLTEQGFHILQADDLRSAVNLMSQEIPELMIIEMQEGAEAAFQALLKFRDLEKLKELPILLILAPKESEHKERLCRTPGVHAIGRPFTHAQIADALHDLLDSSLADTSPGPQAADDLTL